MERAVFALQSGGERHARGFVAALEDRPFADHDLKVRVFGHQPVHVLEARLAIGAVIVGEFDQHFAALRIAEHHAGEGLEHVVAHLGQPLFGFLRLVGLDHLRQHVGVIEQEAARAVVGEPRVGPDRGSQKAERQRGERGQQGLAQR